jgi:hypothetical protein
MLELHKRRKVDMALQDVNLHVIAQGVTLTCLVAETQEVMVQVCVPALFHRAAWPCKVFRLGVRECREAVNSCRIH